MLKFKKVVVALSGGVDSAVSTLLLKQKGYDVEAVFMQNWDLTDETGFCQANQDYYDASLICDRLGVPLKKVNFVKQYWNEVFCNLLKEYESGCTPNPDILCNRHVKFNHFYDYARKVLKADAIATGHYARTSFGPFLENYAPDKRRARDENKDQTLFLCQVNQETLQRTMFPLSYMKKTEVKEMARRNNLDEIANKKESMGICFIGTRNFQQFISEYVDNKPGSFVDIDTGKPVGTHKGMHQWTLGQRTCLKGLPVAYFVARKDPSGTIYVAKGTHHPALFSNTFFTDTPHWIHSKPKELVAGDSCKRIFKFQHTQERYDCEICETRQGCVVLLDEYTRALTPGQFAVFYDGDECLGGARICKVGPARHLLEYNTREKSILEPPTSKIKVKVNSYK